MAAKVLLVEDDRALREALADTLCLGGHDYRAVDCAEAALVALSEEPFGLVVSDVNMPGMDGHQLLAQIRTRHPQLPVLLMTAFGAVERAVDAIRQGAADYLVKPFEPRTLLELVAKHALGKLPAGDRDGPVALEPASVQLLELAARVAQSDSTVMITGESGTGKEVVARGIHSQSHRAAGPFVAVNCGAIPGELLESELFGHEKGAFTGAIQARVGRFEQAASGTLFLDEIGDMPQGMQVKLLRVLQERTFERVGSNKTQQCDVRIIAATHQDLEAHAEEGKFRADLYYRLNVFPIEIPPLRERPDDVQVIGERFLEGFNKQRGTSTKVSKACFDALRQYQWPGNARELSNLMERLTILHPDEQVSANQLPNRWRQGSAPADSPETPRVPDFSFTEEPVIEERSELVLSGLTEEGIDLRSRMAEIERTLISQALDLSDGVVAQAAKLLGLQRTTLVEKMRKHGLERSE